MSQANFKVGLTTEDKRLHDLIIDVKPSQTSTFKIEMIKYLKTLNRI